MTSVRGPKVVTAIKIQGKDVGLGLSQWVFIRLSC